jgi:hypothetical protein
MLPRSEFFVIWAETACWELDRKLPNVYEGLLLAALPSSMNLIFKLNFFIIPASVPDVMRMQSLLTQLQE